MLKVTLPSGLTLTDFKVSLGVGVRCPNWAKANCMDRSPSAIRTILFMSICNDGFSVVWFQSGYKNGNNDRKIFCDIHEMFILIVIDYPCRFLFGVVSAFWEEQPISSENLLQNIE